MECLPDELTENELLMKVYEDVNDLYTDEHLIMTQADLLEQAYSMVSAMHSLTRHEELVVSKNKAAQEEAKRVDPDSFPINKLS